MAYIVQNIRLKELVAIAHANKPFYDFFRQEIAKVGYPTLHSFVSEVDDAKATAAILAFLRAPVPTGTALLDGVGAPYGADKGKWLLLGWIFRDAPEQRLRPMVFDMPGASVSERQAHLLNSVRSYARDVLPDPRFWKWHAVLDVMVDRLEGSRRAKKGNLFEAIVRRALEKVFKDAKLNLKVSDTQLKIGGETYDVVVNGQKGQLLIPVKTRETMGGGHAHIFTRDIHKSIAEAIKAGYPCLPVIIAESWTGDLQGLACDDHIYIGMNPNQVAAIEPVLVDALRKRVPLFKKLS